MGLAGGGLTDIRYPFRSVMVASGRLHGCLRTESARLVIYPCVRGPGEIQLSRPQSRSAGALARALSLSSNWFWQAGPAILARFIGYPFASFHWAQSYVWRRRLSTILHATILHRNDAANHGKHAIAGRTPTLGHGQVPGTGLFCMTPGQSASAATALSSTVHRQRRLPGVVQLGPRRSRLYLTILISDFCRRPWTVR